MPNFQSQGSELPPMPSAPRGVVRARLLPCSLGVEKIGTVEIDDGPSPLIRLVVFHGTGHSEYSISGAQAMQLAAQLTEAASGIVVDMKA